MRKEQNISKCHSLCGRKFLAKFRVALHLTFSSWAGNRMHGRGKITWQGTLVDLTYSSLKCLIALDRGLARCAPEVLPFLVFPEDSCCSSHLHRKILGIPTIPVTCEPHCFIILALCQSESQLGFNVGWLDRCLDGSEIGSAMFCTAIISNTGA